MQVEMIWENGVLRPVRPLRFKRRMVTVEVADADVEAVARPQPAPSTSDAIIDTGTTGVGAELNALMKGYRGRIPAAKPREDKAAWHQHLEEKYLNRD
ncbi:hypothetical protein [Nitrococcus mobilis]|uniref:Uncharacterized protein n=1 Tax=Nitrococcus mobilis Nb-231 TaxID=314278 RepID=A4BMF7_9GAMM|nr:hypothetical protein [Nitrococcus mobilis]EAR23495.1 hypothetical protein NB231_16783 [Nitrococcus mobilis Nb-231]